MTVEKFGWFHEHLAPNNTSHLHGSGFGIYATVTFWSKSMQPLFTFVKYYPRYPIDQFSIMHLAESVKNALVTKPGVIMSCDLVYSCSKLAIMLLVAAEPY